MATAAYAIQYHVSLLLPEVPSASKLGHVEQATAAAATAGDIRLPDAMFELARRRAAQLASRAVEI